MQEGNACSLETSGRGALRFLVSRASSDFAESFGISVATVTTGSERVSRLPWLVWRITADRRRAIMWALRRSVSANATMTEPSS